MAEKRNYLSLERKIEVIKTSQQRLGTSIRPLAEMFNCGKTQIARILKTKDTITRMYESNVSGRKVHTSTISRTSEYSDINKALYDWFTLASSKNIHPGGPQLIEKAKQIAVRLGIPEFKGSNGWLEKWKKTYNIRQFTVSGESGDVQGATVDSWKERLPEIVQGYSKDDIWNMDETGVFWQALPDRGFAQRGKRCKGGEKSKQRITIAFFVTAAGSKEKPVVIWKYKNPRCMKQFDKSVLPVTYFNQTKAWMTGDILESIMTKLNSRLSCEKRSIILLLDNAGCHPKNLKSRFSNIKVSFLPANTTSI